MPPRRQCGSVGRSRPALVLAALLVVWAVPLPGAAEPTAEPRLPASDSWSRLLEGFVLDGGLDYAGVKAAPEDLQAFVEAFAGARLAGAGREEQLAFWINAYNATVVRQVIERYPAVDSVRSIEGFFDDQRVSVAGEHLTLDEIEGRAMAFADPRVHFALVCAAESCPPLRREAYESGQLSEQLDDQTRRFLADSQRGLSWDRERRRLALSTLFKWYGADFTGGTRLGAYLGRGQLVDWVLPYLNRDLAAEIEAAEVAVVFMDYDWSLNDRRR